MFDAETLYTAKSKELLRFISASSLAQRRVYGKGPPYIKFGGKVFYKGSDLNSWLMSRRVEPQAA